MASRQELEERLDRIAYCEGTSGPFLKFLEEVCFEGKFPFSMSLEPLEKDLYAVDHAAKERYLNIVSKASTYFYKKEACYKLKNLVSYLEREFAKEWEGFPDGCIEKILRISSKFIIYKNRSGLLEIMSV